MNLNIGDSNLIVKFIQYFLQKYYSISTVASGTLDDATLYALYKYLKSPNVAPSLDVYNNLLDTYPNIQTYYQLVRSPDSISMLSYGERYSDSNKQENYEKKQYEYTGVLNVGTEDVSNIYRFSASLGWRVSEFDDFNNIGKDNRCRITLTQIDKQNRFPNNDLLCLLNLYYGYSIPNMKFDTSGAFTKSDVDKIAYFKAEPNSVYTIAHGYSESLEIKVGCMNVELSNPLIASNISLYTATNVVISHLNAGSSIVYKTDSTTQYIVVQMPDYQISKLIPNESIVLGDINGDGLVTEADRLLLYYQVGTAITGYYHSNNFYQEKIDSSYNGIINPIIGQVYQDLETGKRYKYINSYSEISMYVSSSDEFKAADITGDGILNSVDLSLLSDYVGGTNKNDLLAIYGKYNPNYNIPFNEFIENPWSIHDKLINYILDSAITPFSDGTDIAYLQTMMSILYPEQNVEIDGFYSDDLRELVTMFQNSNNIYFALGYLDVETEALMARLAKGGSYPSLYDNAYLLWSSDSYLIYNEDESSYVIVRQVKR